MSDRTGLVVGYDGSECADAALDAAIELAAAFGDSITLVYAAAPGGYGGGEVPAQREAVEELGQRELERGKARAERREVQVEIELVPKKPADALADAAGRLNARLIVIGTHSEKPLRAAIIGSTPPKLLAVSEIPVVVVPLR
jgi:nucleotide-binding universal stress UspA family protein